MYMKTVMYRFPLSKSMIIVEQDKVKNTIKLTHFIENDMEHITAAINRIEIEAHDPMVSIDNSMLSMIDNETDEIISYSVEARGLVRSDMDPIALYPIENRDGLELYVYITENTIHLKKGTAVTEIPTAEKIILGSKIIVLKEPNNSNVERFLFAVGPNENTFQHVVVWDYTDNTYEVY